MAILKYVLEIAFLFTGGEMGPLKKYDVICMAVIMTAAVVLGLTCFFSNIIKPAIISF